jgi:hypothetical protein
MVTFNKLSAKNLNGVIPILCEIVYIDEEDIEQHIYLTDNNESILWDGVSSSIGTGNEYLPCAIRYTMPDNQSGEGAKLSISSVDQTITKILREIDNSPTFIIKAMLIENPLSGSPIISELDGQNFLLNNISGTATTIQATLGTALLLDRKCPRMEASIVTIPCLA